MRNMTKQTTSTFDPILDGRISTAEMSGALKQLKNKKSPGPDGILAEYLKAFGENYEYKSGYSSPGIYTLPNGIQITLNQYTKNMT